MLMYHDVLYLKKDTLPPGLELNVPVGPAPTLLKLIVDGLLMPRPLAADFFLAISRTSENRKSDNS